MEDPTMLELLGIRNVTPQLDEKAGVIPEDHQELQPSHHLNLIKGGLGNVPTDTGSFSTLPSLSEPTGLLPCSEQSGVKRSGMSDDATLAGHSVTISKTHDFPTGIITLLPGTSADQVQTVQSFERQPLSESNNTCHISQIAHIAHRVQPDQECEYAITKHKIIDVLNNPFMCGICGNIFSTTTMIRYHVIRDHCLSIASEHGHSEGCGGGVGETKGDRGPKESENRLDNISDSALREMCQNNLTGQQVRDGEHSTNIKIALQEAESAHLKGSSKQKMEKKCGKNAGGERKESEGLMHCNENYSKKTSPQRIHKNLEKLNPAKVEQKLGDLNVVTADPPKIDENKTKQAKRFKCEFCDEIFTSNKYRYKHRVASHSDCLFTCPNCGKTFKVQEKDKWQHHVRNHNKPPKKPKQDSYHCQVCSMVFRAASSVAIHMQTFHPENVQVERPFCCEVCGKLFRTKRTIKLHQTLVHSNEKPYKCEMCGRGFKVESYLKLHLRTHTGEKPFACKFCNKTFPSTAGRRSHERAHTNERPYKCSHCGKGFKAKPQLVEHERTHTKEKPYVCPVCGKAFASRTSFATHKFLHTGKKPFQCSHCSRAFAQKCNLEHHVRSVHTLEKPYQCNICGVGFSRSTGRSMHMEKKHGIKVSLRQGRPPLFSEAQEIEEIVQAGCVSIDVSSGIMGHTILEDTLSLVVDSLDG